MPTFDYKATDQTGKIIEGQLEGKDATAVIARLQEMQYFPIRVQQQAQKTVISRSYTLRGLLRRVRSRDVMVFTQQLATLVDAGIPLDRALNILGELNENTGLGPILTKVQRNIEGGSSLADALAKHPRQFSRLYVNMVRSGESGGVLEAILVRLASFLEQSQEMVDEIKSAMIYPALLVMVGGVAIGVLLTFVIPKFAMIFADVGIALPLPTRIVIHASNFLSSYWYLILIGLFFIVYGIRNYRKTEKGRIKWDAMKLKLPMFGQLYRKIEIARFSRTLGTLIRSGVPILQAISIVKDTLTNEVIAQALVSVYGGLKEGEGVAQPLQESGVFPPLAVHMISVGEETGSLETMLGKVADSYETDVSNSIKRLMSLLEPAMILLMGVLIGFVVVSMLLAIFSISDIAV